MNITTAENDIEYILFNEEQIKARVAELGAELAEYYKGTTPVMAGVLNGASIFHSDLVRAYKGHLFIDFIQVSSYGTGTSSSGTITFKKDFGTDIKGKDVLIVEDIVDSGLTLKYLKEMLKDRGVKSVKTIAFLNKYECHPRELDTDFYGFKIENNFVVGYGLDYAQHYRNLPYIGVLKKQVYES